MKQIGLGTFSVSELAREYVGEVLDSGRISYGPMSREFERQMATIHGCRYGVLSNSGTSSLQVALQAMKIIHGWKDGDEVIVPAVTFVATVNVVLHNGMKPVLVDVDKEIYNIDPGKIEAAITERTRAIIPVHLFGQPADMKSVMDIARKHNLKVIEDSCECMFATIGGKPVGSFGDIACFSTYVAHLITTGVGGIATTSNAEYASLMRSLVNHGRDGIYISIDDDEEITPEIISRRFSFEHVGHSFRITELEAALGLAQLETYEEMIRLRRANATTLQMKLLHDPRLQNRLQVPVKIATHSHSWMMFPIVLKDASHKLPLVQWLEENGIETRDMLPLTNQPVYKKLGVVDDENEWPVAKWINECGFYVGCHQDLTMDDMLYIYQKIVEFFDEAED